MHFPIFILSTLSYILGFLICNIELLAYTKILPVIVLLHFLHVTKPNYYKEGELIIMAFVFCLFGDFFLIFMNSLDDLIPFALGIGSFATALPLFTLAILLEFRGTFPTNFLHIYLILQFIGLSIIHILYLPILLSIAIFIYTFFFAVLLTMALSASWTLFVGFAMFATSDVFFALNYILLAEGSLIISIFIMYMYWIGLYLVCREFIISMVTKYRRII